MINIWNLKIKKKIKIKIKKFKNKIIKKIFIYIQKNIKYYKIII